MVNKTPHILVVDDNAENIRILGAVLERQQYKISIANNGEMALKMARKTMPDLILLDVMMPDINGFEVCETLKTNPDTQNITIIFISAAISPANELKGLSLGAVDYLYKPFSMPIIQAKVALHLQQIYHKQDLYLKNEALEKNAKLREDIERITRHDLKTPLNAIIGYPQIMLMDNNLTEEQRGYLEEIIRAGNEMNNMINNSLDLFKMETGCYPYTPEWIDLSLLMKTIIRDLRPLSEQYGVAIDVSHQSSKERQIGQSDNFIVLAEKTLCYSVFANLIRNAIEACATHDRIHVAMSYHNEEAVIAITNPGTVPVAIRETFFEKYTTAGKTHGTGLGTYSAKLMTETQKGSITMETDEQETCITVRLPCK